MHSHDYRQPEPFEGKTILCLGAGASGIDIAIDLSSVARKVSFIPNSLFTYSLLLNNNLRMKDIMCNCEFFGAKYLKSIKNVFHIQKVEIV